MRRLLVLIAGCLSVFVGFPQAHAQHPSLGVIASDPPEVATAIREGYVPWRIPGGNPTGKGLDAEILRRSGWPVDVQGEFLQKVRTEIPQSCVLPTGLRLDFNSQGGTSGRPLIVESTVVALPNGGVISARCWEVLRTPTIYHLAEAVPCNNKDGWRGDVPPPQGPPVGHVPIVICETCCR